MFFSKPRASGVIVYLAPPGALPHRALTIGQDSGNGDFDNFTRSLRLLKKNFLDRFPRPVVVFYEEGFSLEMQQALVEKTGVTPTFAPIEFKLPEFLDPAAVPKMYADKFPMGYRHMCRFFSARIFEEKALAGYDWVWRLDTDSFITSPIEHDLFDWMNRKGYDYGYNYVAPEDQHYIEGLWEAHLRFLCRKKIKPTFLHKFVEGLGWNKGCFYTNFEISRVSFWKSPIYQEYFDYLDHLGGIYLHRWGDAPIHTLALASFLPESKVVQLNQFGYEHFPLVMDASGKVTSGFGEWFFLNRKHPREHLIYRMNDTARELKNAKIA